MREILFRGKRIDNDEWAYGNFVMDATEQVQREKIPLEPILADGFIRRYDLAQQKIVMHEVDRKTVGQYTGLTDKNGKRIFEGDVISHIDSYQNKIIGVVAFNCAEARCVIEWKKSKETSWIRNDLGFWATHREIEIIGNIHDNPEFMGGGEENAAD